MKNKLVKLSEKLRVIEEEIMLELGSLPNNGGECHCERNLGSVKIVHHGSMFYEVFEYCLECGGLIEHE